MGSTLSPAASWYALPANEVLRAHGSSPDGLASSDARKRLGEHGPNELPDARRRTPVGILLGQLRSPFLFVLEAAMLVTVVIEHYFDTAVIATAISVNVIIGFMQEYHAERSLESLKRMNAPRCVVVRDGLHTTVPTREVVPGDIVVLEAGVTIPADGRVVEAHVLQVEEAMLTGESLPVMKHAEPIADARAGIAERTSCAFMGTHIVGGRGLLLVTGTGPETEIGRIAASLDVLESEPSPLAKNVRAFSRNIGICAALAIAAVLAVGLVRGFPFTELLLFALGEMVSIIPEGLPAAVSIVLAVGIRRMAKREAVVRKMSAVETVGAATVICTDKTGTITENRMRVVAAYLPGHPSEMDVGHARLADGGVAEASLAAVCRISAVCNDLREEEEEGEVVINGDPTEVALYLFASELGIAATLGTSRRVAEIPFSHERRFMAVAVAEDGGGMRLYLKGAPESVLDRCRYALEGDHRVEADEARKDGYAARAEAMSRAGLRVLGFAYRDVDLAAGDLSDADAMDLVFVGLLGLIDPPRAGVADSIRRCREAGIRVIMLTGDHALTAQAIARSVGLVREGREAVVQGDRLESADDAAFARELARADVFARVSPHAKLRVVEALKAQGEVVVVTGDGVNDAPALKRADVGVAMGKTGTDVAREASDIVLTSDDFNSIVDAVEEGRLAFKNVKRVVAFLFTTNLSEAVVLIACMGMGFPLPLVAAQILWLNMVTAAPAVFSLSLEPKHRGLMRERPRTRTEGFITTEVRHLMAVTVAVMMSGILGLYSWKLGSGGLESARTVVFTGFVLFEIFNAFNCRSLGEPLSRVGLWTNRYFLVGLVAAVSLQALAVYHPALQTMLRTVPLSGFDWLAILLVTPWIVLAGEIQKRVISLFRGGPATPAAALAL